MKTLNHTVSFPSTVGELVVQYNFTEAEPAQVYHSGKKEWITATNWTPAEVEITDVSVMLFGHLSCYFDETDTERAKNSLELKQAIYTEHMRLLKEKEDAEARRQDGHIAEKMQKIEYIDGQKYQLDLEFNNSGVVTLLSHGTVLCVVQDDGGGQWTVMLNRLTPIPKQTSALHEHAKSMWDLGQELLGLKDSKVEAHVNKDKQQLELTITEPEQLYPYSAEIPASVQQKGIYVKMPKGVPLPDHILDVGNHLEQPEI
jgi:hypothetical protein